MIELPDVERMTVDRDQPIAGLDVVREERLEVLERRMDELALDKEGYDWYLDLRRYGTVPHAGFGLGFERMLMYVTGMQNIRDVIPFARTPGNAATLEALLPQDSERMASETSSPLSITVGSLSAFPPTNSTSNARASAESAASSCQGTPRFSAARAKRR